MSFELRWKRVKSKSSRTKRSLQPEQEHRIEKPVTVDITSTGINDVRQYFLKYLLPFSIYSFRVRERTVRGWGPFTASMQAATLEGGKHLSFSGLIAIYHADARVTSRFKLRDVAFFGLAIIIARLTNLPIDVTPGNTETKSATSVFITTTLVFVSKINSELLCMPIVD